MRQYKPHESWRATERLGGMSQALNVVHATNRSARHCACASLHSFRFTLASSRERSSRGGTEREASTARSSSHPRSVRLRVVVATSPPASCSPRLLFSLSFFLVLIFFRSLYAHASLFFFSFSDFHPFSTFSLLVFGRLFHSILLYVHSGSLENVIFFLSFFVFYFVISHHLAESCGLVTNSARQEKSLPALDSPTATRAMPCIRKESFFHSR